jgi:L-lactate dehydrogenase complex protein LldF
MSEHVAWGPPFPRAARTALADRQLRENLAAATATIRDRRAGAVGEVADWEELREAGREIKARTLASLDVLLPRLEAAVTARGGTVHWARDAAEAADVVRDVARAHGASEVVKVKSLATDEIGLNERLAEAGITAIETDLAELICQLGHERSSHILVPAIHRNRGEIAALFRRTIAPGLDSDEPADIAEAARLHLRERFLRARVGVSGANFAVAETGTVCVVESEGNGRMCTTLPEVLVTVCGIEKLLPEWRDLDVFLQLLPRSATGERMSPYTSLWSGVSPGDGPREFHLILLDNGRTDALADEVGRDALACIRCSACLNICPVYRRTGGHAYGSVYPGPIGAILTPLLRGPGKADSLPFASSLCAACADVCPVKIDIPRILVHLRGRAVRAASPGAEAYAMRGLARILGDERRYARAQGLARRAQRLGGRTGLLTRLPGPIAAWSAYRDLPEVADQTFREWWASRGG